MNRADFDKLVADTMATTGELLIKKGAEYAGDADRLANFKRNAEKNGQTVLETWQTYWGKHVDSINSYMARVKVEAVKLAIRERVLIAHKLGSTGLQLAVDEVCAAESFPADVNKNLPLAMLNVDHALSEPIEGRFDDNINYSILCKAILHELRQGPQG